MVQLMQDNMNEKISRLIDGDLDHAETLELLKKIQTDESLRLKLWCYQTISQTLKSDVNCHAGSDFSRKVFQDIQQEPPHFLPQISQAKTLPQTPKTQQQHGRMWLAVAASTVAAAVLVAQAIRNEQNTGNIQSITAMASPQLALPASYPSSTNSKPVNRRPLNAQFNEYLQAHNSSVYINGEAEFQPYARVASFGRE